MVEMSGILQGKRIIIVDDDLLTLELFNFVLTSNHAEVKTATSAARALEILDSWIPHILISDISMPHEDGFSFIQKIRKQESIQAIPMIAVTGYSSQDDRKKLRDAGYCEVLIKPIDPDQLLSLIHTILSDGQTG
jgi:CheY-like chemotaxis protein